MQPRLAPLVALLLAPALVPPTLADAPAPVPLEITDCAYVEALHQVPGALVRPYVPPEFSVVTTSLVQFLVGVATCTGTSGAQQETISFGWADVSVLPPTSMRDADVRLYLYRIEHVVADDLYRRVHATFGAECRVMDDVDVGVSLADVHAIARAPGFEQTLRVAAGVPDAVAPGPGVRYREFGPAAGGYVYLEGTLRAPAEARDLPGVLLTGESSALRPLVGPALAGRVQYGNGFEIVDNTIGFIPRASAPAPVATC